MSTSEYPAPRLGGPRLRRLRPIAAAKRVPVEVWIVGGAVLAAALIRFVTISSQSFWTDEALTAYEAHLPFGAMVHTVLRVETSPPLYFVVIWVWAHIFGTTEVALRSLSALAGIALVPIAYLSARELISKWAGVIAAAFVTVNPFLIWYSQEARAYMLLALLTGASFLWFVRARRDPSTRNLAWWAIWSSLALMTHFFAGFVIAPEALLLLWVSRTRAVLLAVATVAAAQAAVAPIGLIDSTHGTGWIAASSKLTRLGDVPLEFGVKTLYRSTTTGVGLLGGAIFLGIVVLLLAVGGDRVTRRGAGLAMSVAGFGLLAPLALGFLGQDYFLARNLMPVWFPLAIAACAACVVPRARVAGALLATVLIALFVASDIEIQGNQYLQRPAWREVSHLLGASSVPRAILAANGAASDPLKIYLPNVNWVQPQRRKSLISEIDLVGSRRRQFLVADSPSTRVTTRGAVTSYMGGAIPRAVAPAGSRLITRVGLDQWVVARFALRRPMAVDVHQLIKLAPHFFRRAPKSILVFFQRPGH
jgi:mannosyltransferase